MDILKLQEFITTILHEKLSHKLTYHGIHHTMEVLDACKRYIDIMQIPEYDAYLLETAALMHDTGFLFTYDDHEDSSIMYTREILPRWQYTEQEIEKVCGMINATKIPQKPANKLEQIIGDSDLDYLGTESFYAISETLYKELLAYNKITNRDEWHKVQVAFLQKHQYHTDFAHKHREPVKQRHLKMLLDNDSTGKK